MPLTKPTPPAAIPAIPTPVPQRSDMANFAARGDATMTALPGSVDGMNASTTYVTAAVNFAEEQVTLAAAQVGLATTQAGNADTARIAAQAAATTATNAPGTSGTSTTSMVINATTQTFTTQTGKAWVVGQPVVIARTSAPGTTRMSGVITAYNSGTGSMSVLVDALLGTGTYTDWTIALGTDRSLAGQVTAVAMAANNIDCSLGTYFTKTIAGNTTLTVSNVPPSGTRYACIIEITHTSGVITPPTGYYWAGGITPTLTTGKVHLLYLVTRDGGTKWRMSSLPNFNA